MQIAFELDHVGTPGLRCSHELVGFSSKPWLGCYVPWTANTRAACYSRVVQPSPKPIAFLQQGMPLSSTGSVSLAGDGVGLWFNLSLEKLALANSAFTLIKKYLIFYKSRALSCNDASPEKSFS